MLKTFELKSSATDDKNFDDYCKVKGNLMKTGQNAWI